MKKELELHWENEGLKNSRQLHDNAYFAGFHHGRHKERDALVNSGWLIIDPSKREEFNNALQDPCMYCEHYTPEYKKGCVKDISKCQKKQKQYLAIEIKTYFDNKI